MDKKLTIKIISQTGKIKKELPETADMVVIPCTTGELGVLPGRLPCTMALGKGRLRVTENGELTTLKVDGGLATVSGNVVTVLGNFGKK